ncbi:SSD1 protein [Lactarius hatsudake]|nr:SSD1 protein [Lactarius hatsudake]
MTDEQQDTSNKDGRKPSSNPASGTNRGQRRNPSVSKPSNSAAQPSKSGSNKKPGTPATESGSENGKKPNDGKKGEQRRQPQSGGGQGKANHRKGQSTASQNSRNNNGQSANKPGASAPPPPDSSDALSSLQRVIADLKTTSPPNQPAPLAGNTLPTSASAPIAQTTTSNLPANAPVFQPGASIYPPPSASEPPPRHRKAASMGMAGFSSNFGSLAPHLGSMREDVEDGQNGYEEGEIQESLYSTQPQGHHPRSQSQSFTAPRFAALAQQEQQQSDIMGPSGRPQLAPNFMFGARNRVGNIMAPPINEEDAGFQFPQQQQQQSYSDQEVLQRRNEGSGEIRGIMAEQIAIQNEIEALQRQQAALYQQQLASNQVLSFQTPGLAPNRGAAHRRVQSTVPMGFGAPSNPSALMSQLGLRNVSLGLDGQPQSISRGHGRRHSVNVVNKSGSQSTIGGQDGFDDGFAPPTALGGHSRQVSRADSAWRLNGGVGGVQQGNQQQQQFQSQLQQQSSQPQRKSLFAPYLPQASLPPLLATGKLVVGILRVNKRNRSDAYVSTEVLDADIYICGSKDRNRALEGDIVAVELLDVDEVWGTKKEKEEKKRKKEENAAYEVKSAAGRKNDKKKDDVEVEGQGLMLFEDEGVTDEVKPQFAGHVVAVVERMPGQLFSGTLGLLRPSSAATKEKQEAERREREGDQQAPPDFVQNSEGYSNKLFVACIKRHPISSLHPFGTLVEELGPIGDIEVETSALLKDSNFPTEDFSESVLKCLPPMPWTIPDHEYEVRTDLRGERAKDLDDALSIKPNDDGTYDVGIHIADVSFHVKPNTALDRDARKRATSVYLVQRVVPMLPPALSEELCSLVPGAERLAFSVVLTLTKEAKVIKKWFGKTVVKSAAKLSYNAVQGLLDGKPLADITLTPGHEASSIEKDVYLLYDLAKVLRTRRFQHGALRLSSPSLSFKLNDKGLPVDCSQSSPSEASAIVEEFMLLANIAASQQIAVALPEQALLRRHDAPIDRRLNLLVERAERLGYKLDVTSAGSLMRSFDAVEDPSALGVLQLLSFKATHRAKYFCAGMLDIAKYSHYALNVPLYTHFTSPIRRYADIMVHRQLESALQSSVDNNAKFNMDRDAVAKVTQQCNIKRDSAVLAQEQSAHLFLCVLISNLTARYGPVIRQAKVIGVLDAAFDVLVPEFGIEKRVHVDQMPIDNHVYDEHSHTLQIYWSDRDENSDDEHLKKVKENAEQHAVKMEIASRSVHDEKALFDEDDGDDEIVLGRDTVEVEEEEVESVQREISKAKVTPGFEGLRTTPTGHKIQQIKELMTVPVIVTADLTKSPPVIKVYSVNPYAEPKE